MSLFGAESIFGDVVSDGMASFQSAIATAKAAVGNVAVDSGSAIAALQAAGNAAVGVVGPGIDMLSGSDPKTMQVTHFAWLNNGKLASVGSGSSATVMDLQSAISIASDMARQYGEAYRNVTVSKARGGMGVRAPVAPKPAAPAYVAPTTPAVAPLAPLPAVAALAPVPETGLDPATKTTIAVSTGGVFGLLLGGAVGLRAGARVGLFIGGPVGALFGAGAGWALMRVLAPAPSAQVAVAAK